MAFSSLFQRIISADNLEQAFFDVMTSFYNDEKSYTYAGIDGVRLVDIDTSVPSVLFQVQAELLDMSPVDPVRLVKIPKSNGSYREVALFTVKDRIKAQAIFRVVSPLIDEQLSPYLFSYRPGIPHYLAAKSVARRHRSHHTVDTVVRLDVKDYFDNINREVAFSRLQTYGIDDDVIERLLLFADAAHIDADATALSANGGRAGISLSMILANAYLDDLDYELGRKVSLYRRVGDDLILCDKDAGKLEHYHQYIKEEFARRKLTHNQRKTAVYQPGMGFNFLGYSFSHGLVRVDRSAEKRVQQKLKTIFSASDLSAAEKQAELPRRWFYGYKSCHDYYLSLLQSYRYVTDDEQIKALSFQATACLADYLYGVKTPRAHRRAHELQRRYNLPTLYDYYRELRYGHTKIRSLLLSKKRRYQTAVRQAEAAPATA